ncbi:RHS repeat domain-containing protein [Lunatimonas salinarum]|uniref:RHS repeat domain-containing protein n=1 Tax=Lunatimonas salinarum TaxID=1774590 RepID=UPI001AE01AA6|nr:RHS repeat-associated core domain-containing protein [Lunatimonas salinarum]
MTYEYYAFSNKLKNVDGSEDENYTYDEIGNLIADTEEGITNIEWTPYGKVRKVVKDDNSEVHFRYDASGNRIAKITATDTTVYARDASGNVMAVYKGNNLEEQSIYGSSRLGLVNYASKTGYRSLGGKKYELSNHLGNVLAVVSDNIHLNQDSTWTSLINTTDYYPFGLAMDGRSVQDSTSRYGFNGKELDAGGEWGGQNNYDYGFRIYNPTIAKFLSVDPLFATYPYLTPYQFASNTPIAAIDRDGLEAEIVINSPWFLNEIQRAWNTGDVDRSQQLALSSINKSRPAGNWAEIEYKGAVNAGTFNWNESNPNVLTVFDSDHNEIFKIVKEQQMLQHTEKGFWESLWENVSGWLDFDIEGSGGGSQPGGIHFYAEGASGSPTISARNPVDNVDISVLYTYITSTKFGPGGPTTLEVEEVASTISNIYTGINDLTTKTHSPKSQTPNIGNYKYMKVCVVCGDTLEMDRPQRHHTEFDTIRVNE